ncbi:MAG: DNA-packaging protein [Gammaproteobacteria bacterium]|nr:DNA-packaging protein [Gammaproteobacteria bacterium]
MREIKFRAAYQREIYPVYALRYDEDGLKVLLGNYIASKTVDNKNLELMQYTGLKDKNGKKIYEGDILSIIVIRGENLYEYTTDVIYEDAEFTIKGENTEQYDTFLSAYAGDGINLAEAEIIGNIYENPELLEGENND